MPGTATGRLGLTWYARKAIVCLIPHLVIRVRAFSTRKRAPSAMESRRYEDF
jgi:hypothetical protein